MLSRLASKLHGESNALYRIRDELKAQGHDIRDLVSGNINDHGFLFPQDMLEEIFVRGARRCQIYHPDSFGQRPAREAISEYYRGCGHEIRPDQILITPAAAHVIPGGDVPCRSHACRSLDKAQHIGLDSVRRMGDLSGGN